MRLRDRFDLSDRVEYGLVRAMEAALVLIFLLGVYLGNVAIIVNAGIALLVAQIPGVLQRDFSIPMDVGLTLWITAAVFLHALGTVPLPAEIVEFVGAAPDGAKYASLYGVQKGWWDHLTHGLSASVVAGVGYATARGIDEYAEDIDLPPVFMFVFILLFVVAFGVLWEVIEFAVSELAKLFGKGSVLVQYGLTDTMVDLLFDIVGGIVVAIWGTAHLNDVADAVSRRLRTRTG